MKRSLYENSWIEVYKNLNQWDALSDISEKTNDFELRLEVAWQKKDFSILEQFLNKKDKEKDFLPENSSTYLLQVLIPFLKL